MQLVPATLGILNNGFNTAFNQGIESVVTNYDLVAMQINSNHLIENYGWVKQMPGMRKWVGQRVINQLEMIAYSVANEPYEHTIGVGRYDIMTDQIGKYTLMFQQQGVIISLAPQELVWAQLSKGFDTVALDGQYFFDTDHIGHDKTGAEISYSNYQSGSNSSPWFLMNLATPFIKPLVFQTLEKPVFVSRTRLDDPHVFDSNEFLFGAHGAWNAGFGFYQLAYASQATLNKDNFVAVRTAMSTQRKPDGTIMNAAPSHLVVGPSNQQAAYDLIMAEKMAGGASNTLWKSVEILVVPTLG